MNPAIGKLSSSDSRTRRAILRSGYVVAALMLNGAISLMLMTIGFQWFDYELSLPNGYKVGLCAPRNLDGYGGITTPSVLFHDADLPYLGSVLSTEPSVAEVDYRNWGVYYRCFSSTTGDSWTTLTISLWWPILASVTLLVGLNVLDRGVRFSLGAVLIAIATEAFLLTLLPMLRHTHPLSLLMNAALLMAIFKVVRMLALGLSRRDPDRHATE